MSIALFPAASTEARRRLGELLVDRGYATAEQVELATRLQTESEGLKLLGEILIERRQCTEEQVLECLAAEMGLPFVRLDTRLCDPNVVDCLPREFLEKHALLPMFQIRGTLTVALPDASDVFLLDRLRDLARCEVQVVMATARDIRRMQQSLLAQSNAPAAVSHDHELLTVSLGGTDLRDERAHLPAGASPAAMVVQNLLAAAVRDSATDIHLEPTARGLRIRFRVDGVLFEHQQLSRSAIQSVGDCLRRMARLDPAARRPQEGRFALEIDGRAVDVCVHTIPVLQGEKITVRLLDTKGIHLALDRLGFSAEILANTQRRLAMRRGLVLVTGPRGSGKTTTLYAALQHLSQSALNICTVEDPVECELPFASQSGVDASLGVTAAALLKALMRQDADVLMAHQLTDLETGQLAVQAALAGSLVLSSLEASDACSALAWMRDMGLEGYQLASSINMVLAQRLCRRVCARCRVEYDPSAATIEAAERFGFQSVAWQRGAGCGQCRQTGFKGRIAIHELLIIDERLRELLAGRASLCEIRQYLHTQGMSGLRFDGLAKAREGLTTPEEVLQVTDESWIPQRRPAAPPAG